MPCTHCGESHPPDTSRCPITGKEIAAPAPSAALAIGQTRGFAKRQGKFVHHGQTKEVYVYVVEPRLRRWVRADPQQLLLGPALPAPGPGEPGYKGPNQ